MAIGSPATMDALAMELGASTPEQLTVPVNTVEVSEGGTDNEKNVSCREETPKALPPF